MDLDEPRSTSNPNESPRETGATILSEGSLEFFCSSDTLGNLTYNTQGEEKEEMDCASERSASEVSDSSLSLRSYCKSFSSWAIEDASRAGSNEWEIVENDETRNLLIGSQDNNSFPATPTEDRDGKKEDRDAEEEISGGSDMEKGIVDEVQIKDGWDSFSLSQVSDCSDTETRDLGDLFPVSENLCSVARIHPLPGNLAFLLTRLLSRPFPYTDLFESTILFSEAQSVPTDYDIVHDTDVSPAETAPIDKEEQSESSHSFDKLSLMERGFWNSPRTSEFDSTSLYVDTSSNSDQNPAEEVAVVMDVQGRLYSSPKYSPVKRSRNSGDSSHRSKRKALPRHSSSSSTILSVLTSCCPLVERIKSKMRILPVTLDSEDDVKEAYNESENAALLNLAPKKKCYSFSVSSDDGEGTPTSSRSGVATVAAVTVVTAMALSSLAGTAGCSSEHDEYESDTVRFPLSTCDEDPVNQPTAPSKLLQLWSPCAADSFSCTKAFETETLVVDDFGIFEDEADIDETNLQFGILPSSKKPLTDVIMDYAQGNKWDAEFGELTNVVCTPSCASCVADWEREDNPSFDDLPRNLDVLHALQREVCLSALPLYTYTVLMFLRDMRLACMGIKREARRRQEARETRHQPCSLHCKFH